jgi:monoamine oxidase
MAAQIRTPGAVPVQPDIWLTHQHQQDDTGVARGGGFLFNIAGTNLTSFETSGSFSRSLQAADPQAAIDHGLETLVGIFRSASTRGFIKGQATAWRYEPYVRGSYAGSMPGDNSQRTVLRRAHAKRVSFAGEASHIGEQCTVSGAHLEGLRAAKDVIAQLGRAQRE